MIQPFFDFAQLSKSQHLQTGCFSRFLLSGQLTRPRVPPSVCARAGCPGTPNGGLSGATRPHRQPPSQSHRPPGLRQKSHLPGDRSGGQSKPTQPSSAHSSRTGWLTEGAEAGRAGGSAALTTWLWGANPRDRGVPARNPAEPGRESARGAPGQPRGRRGRVGVEE